MTKEKQIEILEALNIKLSEINGQLGFSGDWEADEASFNLLSNTVYSVQEKLEELTGETYIV